MEIIKEIRLAGMQESTNWSRDLEEREPETKGETKISYPVRAHCVIRTNSYGSQLSFIRHLAAIAIAEFPTLTEDQVEIVRYGGQRYKGTFGIEFTCPVDYTIVPIGWREISQLEYTSC
jgi:hypothetical protein